MTVDWSKVGSKATAAMQSHEDKKNNLIVTVGNAIGRVFDNNPSDPRLDAIELILGTKAGDTNAILEKLGIELPDNDTETPALTAGPTAGKERPLPVFNPDGTNAGVAMKEQQALDAGYAFKTDDAGAIVGYIKPPAATPAPAAPTTPTHKVEIVDRHDAVKSEIDLDDFMAKATKYQILKFDDDGRPVRAREVRFIGR